MDLDGDGNIDVLSGSWPGELFLFRGGPDKSFAAPVKLKNKHGKTINIGGGLREDPGGDYVLIAGDAKFEKGKDGKDYLLYEGEKIPIPEGKQGGITGTASTAHAYDWDGDGDLDLLVGDIGGGVYFLPNEGSKTAFAFGTEQPLKAGGQAIKAPGGDAGPFVADWDGDGKPDLLVGAGDGSVWLYRNTGKGKTPELAKGEQLVPPGETSGDATGPTRGSRAKICVADWNGDGRPDLLLGDFSSQKAAPPKLTADEKAKHDKLRQERDAAMKEYRLLSAKSRDRKVAKDNAEYQRLREQMTDAIQRWQKLQAQLPREYEQHGWVWVFLRQPPEAKAATR